MKYTYLTLIVLLTLSSCSDVETAPTFLSETAVVEGYIFANQAVDSLRITQSISYNGDGTIIAIDELTVIINDGITDIPLESIGNGYYRNLNHIVKEDTNYTLFFEYRGETVIASTYVNTSKTIEISKNTLALEKIEFSGPGSGLPAGLNLTQEIVEVTWDNSELSYYFVDVEHLETEPEYVHGVFEYFEDQGIERPGRFFRSEPNIVNFYSLDSRRELQFFGTYEITVYRLNAEYAALYNTIGSSTLSLQEPPSNIENGLGIFTAVTAHKLRLEVVKK